MKRFIKFLTLSLAVCLVAFFTIGCSLFGSINVEDAKANLEDSGYEVEVIDNEYKFQDAVGEMDIDGVVAVVKAYGEDDDFAALTAILYVEKSYAKSAEDKVKDAFEKMIEDAEEKGQDEILDLYKDFQVKRIGKWVLRGDKDAIKAFQGA